METRKLYKWSCANYIKRLIIMSKKGARIMSTYESGYMREIDIWIEFNGLHVFIWLFYLQHCQTKFTIILYSSNVFTKIIDVSNTTVCSLDLHDLIYITAFCKLCLWNALQYFGVTVWYLIAECWGVNYKKPNTWGY